MVAVSLLAPLRLWKVFKPSSLSIEKSSSHGPTLGATIVKSDGVQATSGSHFTIKPSADAFFGLASVQLQWWKVLYKYILRHLHFA